MICAEGQWVDDGELPPHASALGGRPCRVECPPMLVSVWMTATACADVRPMPPQVGYSAATIAIVFDTGTGHGWEFLRLIVATHDPQ